MCSKCTGAHLNFKLSYHLQTPLSEFTKGSCRCAICEFIFGYSAFANLGLCYLWLSDSFSICGPCDTLGICFDLHPCCCTELNKDEVKKRFIASFYLEASRSMKYVCNGSTQNRGEYRFVLRHVGGKESYDNMSNMQRNLNTGSLEQWHKNSPAR